MSASKAEFPEKLKFLFELHRYKVMYAGRGRGGAKSWGVARALLIQGATSPFVLYAPESFRTQSLNLCTHLLQSQIATLGLESFYEVQNATIKGVNGSELVFAGLRNNITKIKSFEGIDRVWVEEAQTVSKSSWEALIPTIRKDGSEIWISYNPELDATAVAALPRSDAEQRFHLRNNVAPPRCLGSCPRREANIHSTRKTYAKRLYRKLQWPIPG